MNYPNGMRRSTSTRQNPRTGQGFANRGMTLEEDINITNKYYLETNLAIVHKKPTPVQIVNVNYPKRSAAVITEAYFQQASTTDYNGIYKEKYIDFEAKETNNKTSFPLANFHDHQIKHMRSIIDHGGICFILLRFNAHDETFFVKAEKLLAYWNDQLDGGRKSIPYQDIKDSSLLIPFHYQARVDYLRAIDSIYFSNTN
ncbi:MAG TPA: Holliday junction resolvase RecU [Candidatus Dormibacteraeota bacterium]|nr:Holliday junction resolvase RecU [Candidatus Dormibacteraeota bacterium]